MEAVLMRAFSFLAVIVIGHILRRIEFFKEDDFHVLSKIVMKVTLPAAVIVNFTKADVSLSMLVFTLVGFGFGVVYIALGALMGRDREEKSFMSLNLSGYNIGTFTMPFASSFLGAQAMVVTSMFDMGNSIICLGAAYSVAKMIKDGHEEFSAVKLIRTLTRSVPLDVYLLMTVISLLHIHLPGIITGTADVISGANAFMAMLMLGVGLKIDLNRHTAGKAVRILLVRYAVALTIFMAVNLMLPIPAEYRKALSILAFSPIASAAPVFTAELKEDYGLSSTVNTISIMVSMAVITAVMS